MSVPFKGSGRRIEGGFAATHLQDFKAHVQGNGWRHTADQLDMNPPISIDAGIFSSSTVQGTFDKIATFLNTVGQGFVSIGDGYDVTHADFIVGTGPTPTISDAFNQAFTHPRLRNGGVILVKAGTYYLTTTVNVPPGFVIMGELGGTVIVGQVIEQPMFIMKRSGEDRPKLSPNGIYATDPINKNIFFNIILADNLDGYVASGGPTMTTVPMIRCETGTYTTFDSSTLLGKMGALGAGPGFGRPKTLYAAATSVVGAEETTIVFDACNIDGVSSVVKYDPGNISDKLIIKNDCKIRVFGTEALADSVDPTKNCFALISGSMHVMIADSYFNSNVGNSYVSTVVTFTSGNPTISIVGNEGILTTPGIGSKSLVNDNSTGNWFEGTFSANNINNTSPIYGRPLFDDRLTLQSATNFPTITVHGTELRDGTSGGRLGAAMAFPVDYATPDRRVLLIKTMISAPGTPVRYYADERGEMSITVNAYWTGDLNADVAWIQDDATRKSSLWRMTDTTGSMGFWYMPAGHATWADADWKPISIHQTAAAVTDGSKTGNVNLAPNGIVQLYSPSSGNNPGDSNLTYDATPTPNTLYAKNVIKSWGRIVWPAGGPATVSDGFNIGAISQQGNYTLRVNYNQSMQNSTTSSVVATMVQALGDAPSIYLPVIIATTGAHFDIGFYNIDVGGAYPSFENLTNFPVEFMFHVCGRQSN
jgi:hypothetical protein